MHADMQSHSDSLVHGWSMAFAWCEELQLACCIYIPLNEEVSRLWSVSVLKECAVLIVDTAGLL